MNFKTFIPSPCRILIFIVLDYSAMIQLSLQSDPAREDDYEVQPHSVYYANEQTDIIYFNGGTIEFSCDVICKHNCEILILYNDTSFLFDNGFFSIPFDYTVKEYKSESSQKHTLRIIEANATSVGSYQCLTKVWNATYIVNKEIHFHMAVLGSAKQEIKILSEGDSVFLPCAINASYNLYPQPDYIEWWKDNILCDPYDPLKCGGDVVQDGSLLLTNVTVNVSYHCVVHWSNKTYNACYYHIVIHQSNTYHVSVYPESLKARFGESVQFVCAVSGLGQNYSVKWYNNYNPGNVIHHSNVLDIYHVQLNDSGSYHCSVSNEHGVHNETLAVLKVVEPPTIADFKDLLVDANVSDSVTLNCSFTGHPIPTVYWMRVLRRKNQDIELIQYFNDSTVVIGNTAVLYLSNALKHLGSYQCVAVNEAGYVSRTARVLPKGWTNPVNIYNPIFVDNENNTVIISWDPPDYDGGIPVHYYKLILYDHNGSTKILEDSLNTTTYLWNDLKEYNHSKFEIQFGIIVTDVFKSNRSKIAKTKMLTQQKLPTATSLQATLMVNCMNADVSAKWELTQRHNFDDMNEYCLKYQCTTGLKAEKCNLERSINYTNVSGIPTNAMCWFTLGVKNKTTIYSNTVLCYRNDSVIASSVSLSSISLTTYLSFSTLDISETSSSQLLPHSFVSISTPVISSSSVVSNIITISKSNGQSDTSSNKTRNEESIVWPYILLLVFLVLLSLLGFLVMIIVLKKRNIKREKSNHDSLNTEDFELASDYDDTIKDAFSDTETITINGDKQSLFDAVQYCDTERMYKRILNSASLVSLHSITISNSDLNDDGDIGEATSSGGCASHYFNPNGVGNSSVQAHHYDGSGNSIVDNNETSQIVEGSSTKIV